MAKGFPAANSLSLETEDKHVHASHFSLGRCGLGQGGRGDQQWSHPLHNEGEMDRLMSFARNRWTILYAGVDE